MRRVLFFSLIILGLLPAVQAQKSRVISANNLIESEKFEEAKIAIDQAVQNSKTFEWHRTYLVKGLLCQKAFESGFKRRKKAS